MAKTAAEMVAQANAAIDAVGVEDANTMLGKEDVVFIDVRESDEVAKGKIPGAVHVPRGVLEFIADPHSPMHNEALSSGKQLVIYCASGGRSALAGKTLKDMGIGPVINMKGGFNAWRLAEYEVQSD